MSCIICGLDTGDGCVPLCTLHMPLSELAGEIKEGYRSDWPTGSTQPTHVDYMLDWCSVCDMTGDCGHPEHGLCCACDIRDSYAALRHRGAI